MKLNEIRHVGAYYALTDSEGTIIQQKLTPDQVKEIASDPNIKAKYGKIHVIIDPSITDNILSKSQALTNYDDPLTDEPYLDKHQAF